MATSMLTPFSNRMNEGRARGDGYNRANGADDEEENGDAPEKTVSLDFDGSSDGLGNQRSKSEVGQRPTENGHVGVVLGIPEPEEQQARLEFAIRCVRRRLGIHDFCRMMRKAYAIDRMTALRYLERARHELVTRTERGKSMMRAENLDVLDQIIGDPNENTGFRIKAIEVTNRMYGLEEQPKHVDEDVMPVIEVVVDSADDVHHFNDIQQSLMDQRQRLIELNASGGGAVSALEQNVSQVFSDIERSKYWQDIESMQAGAIDATSETVAREQVDEGADDVGEVNEVLIESPQQANELAMEFGW